MSVIGLSRSACHSSATWAVPSVEPSSTTMICSGGRVCARTLSSASRSEEHTSELQSQSNLVCRLLLEKKKNRARDSAVQMLINTRCSAPHFDFVRSFLRDSQPLVYRVEFTLVRLKPLSTTRLDISCIS